MAQMTISEASPGASQDDAVQGKRVEEGSLAIDIVPSNKNQSADDQANSEVTVSGKGMFLFPSPFLCSLCRSGI
jgi:hypothetical protein